jgi:hypothetical protein
MIVTSEDVDAALNRAMTSVKNLSICSEATGGFSAPVCIICNCLCDSRTLCWIERRAIFDNRMYLKGPASMPEQVRAFYRYRGEERQTFMNNTLLSPHATMKKSESSVAERPRIISFSCCKLCHEHIIAPRYVKVIRHYNVCTYTYAASNAVVTNTNVNTGEIHTAFGSNSNINTGEIRTLFYCTTYASKNT